MGNENIKLDPNNYRIHGEENKKLIGSLAMRAGKQFANSRKVGKQHQNVLVFYKGNPKKIKENYPELDLSDFDFMNQND